MPDDTPKIHTGDTPLIVEPTERDVAQFGTPQDVGEIPQRPELEATPGKDPDDPERKIGWKCYEERGGPIFRIPEGVELHSMDDARALMTPDHMIRNKHGLVTGERVLVQTLFEWTVATISDDPAGAMTGDSLWHMLEWRDDYRWRSNERIACWTCTGSANIKALRKLNLPGRAQDEADVPGV